MKQLFITLIIFTNSFFCFGQNITLEHSFINEYIKNKRCYERKIKSRIKRELVRENIYNFYTAKKLLKEVDLFFVPMFNAKLNDNLNYGNIEDLLNSLIINDKLLFSQVVVYKENSLVGVYDCNELGSCGFSLYKDFPNSFDRIIKQMKRLQSIEYDYTFYIHGILHAIWIVKGKDIMVYYLLNENIYDAQEFLNNFYTDDKIRKIIKFYH